MSSQTKAIINLAALRHNFLVAKRAALHSKIMAVIKADAYGHGVLAVAKALTAADGFAVARLDEALQLRQAGIKKPILVLTGFALTSEVPVFADNELDAVVHSEHQLTLLDKARVKRPLTIWLKINTGMNRLGIDPSWVDDVYNRLSLSEKVRQPIKLMTHLSCADDIDNQETERQITIFDRTVDGKNGEQSIANSAGLLNWQYAQRHWVRPGIMLYGANPFEKTLVSKDVLQAVMTLQSVVIALRIVKKGQSVGYGNSWVADKTSLIATIGIGYGDGYPRRAAEGTPVLIAGQEAFLVGRVSMDTINVNVTACQGISIGDEVILWGEGLPVEDIARKCATISYDLLCGVTNRVPRIYQEK